MNKYQITHNNKNIEETIIKILYNKNDYPQNTTRQKQNPLYSKFSHHIYDTKHEYETVEKTMKILHVEKKCQMLDT
jgi:hypothetical protein